LGGLAVALGCPRLRLAEKADGNGKNTQYQDHEHGEDQGDAAIGSSFAIGFFHFTNLAN
jgi:hypothetical protein